MASSQFEERFFRKIFLAVVAGGTKRLSLSRIKSSDVASRLSSLCGDWIERQRGFLSEGQLDDLEALLCEVRPSPLDGASPALGRAFAWACSSGLADTDGSFAELEFRVPAVFAEKLLSQLEEEERWLFVALGSALSEADDA
jgi:hypothetical protein